MSHTEANKTTDVKWSAELAAAEAKKRKEQFDNNIFVGWWNAKTGG
jgi:hypothetical protein